MTSQTNSGFVFLTVGRATVGGGIGAGFALKFPINDDAGGIALPT
jgi:hypothetical protein